MAITTEDINSAMFQFIEEKNIPDWLFITEGDDVMFPYAIAEINGARRLADILKEKLESEKQ